MKLSSADEISKRVLTPNSEQILSNQYGLSFGDINLKEHIQVSVEDPVQESCDGNTKIISYNVKGDERDNKKTAEDNKPNCTSLNVENNSSVTKIQTEILSMNQSSQTDTLSLQNNKSVQKITSSSSPQITKKTPPSTTKTISNAAKPPVVLAPLVVNKTTPGVSARKTVPLSPTNTVPPRNVVPGRNVAAAAFVPSKKPQSLTQNKINTANIAKTSSSKIQNIPIQMSDKNVNNEESLQKMSLDANRIEEITASDKSEDASNNSKEECSIKLIDDKVIVDLKQINDGEKKSKCDINNKNSAVDSYINEHFKKTENSLCQGKEKEDTVKEDLKIAGRENKREIDISHNELNMVSVNKISNSGQTKPIFNNYVKKVELTDVTVLNASKEASIIKPPNNKTLENKVVPNNNSKPEKCDKTVMTDFPLDNSGSEAIVKHQTNRVAAIVRTKTVPNFARKSNESLSISDSITESHKLTRNNTVSSSKALFNTAKKHTPETAETVNPKPAYASMPKVLRSNTAIELRPSKCNRNAVSVTSRNSAQTKQVRNFGWFFNFIREVTH